MQNQLILYDLNSLSGDTAVFIELSRAIRQTNTSNQTGTEPHCCSTGANFSEGGESMKDGSQNKANNMFLHGSICQLREGLREQLAESLCDKQSDL